MESGSPILTPLLVCPCLLRLLLSFVRTVSSISIRRLTRLFARLRPAQSLQLLRKGGRALRCASRLEDRGWESRLCKELLPSRRGDGRTRSDGSPRRTQRSVPRRKGVAGWIHDRHRCEGQLGGENDRCDFERVDDEGQDGAQRCYGTLHQYH
jgi:hypothetical protein